MGLENETNKSTTGLFTIFASFSSIAGFLALCYDKFGFDSDAALVWALTVTGFLCIFFMLFNYCIYSQRVLHDEVRRCADAKSRLEDSLLKKRSSSKGKKS